MPDQIATINDFGDSQMVVTVTVQFTRRLRLRMWAGMTLICLGLKVVAFGGWVAKLNLVVAGPTDAI